MNRAEALEKLRSKASLDRVAAATFFLLNGAGENLDALRSARSHETDVYVRQRIDLVLGEVQSTPSAVSSGVDETVDAEVESEALLARATEWVGGVILHEMEGPLGRAAWYASREVQDYGVSRTRREIEALKGIFRGIEQLVSATKPPRPTEFDLAQLVSDTARESVPDSELSMIGPRPLVARTDPTLLSLALANGLRNAVEAAGSVPDQAHPVIINWGATDRDYWVSILDKGPGLSGSSASKFQIGSSSKAGHSGFGLAVAKRVMETLAGEVTLRGEPGGGALYEVRWGRSS